MKHIIKIKKCYHERILLGQKTFEVRKNDRDYQVGDELEFRDAEPVQPSPLRGPNVKVIYMHHELGMDLNYVVLGIQLM